MPLKRVVDSTVGNDAMAHVCVCLFTCVRADFTLEHRGAIRVKNGNIVNHSATDEQDIRYVVCAQYT